MMKGIKWGAHISDIPGMVLMGDVGSGKKVYRREGKGMNIGDADLEAVMYGFYKDRLEDAQIHFRSPSNFAKLKKMLFQTCGPGCQPNQSLETYHWFGRKFSMLLTFDEASGKGAISCTFMPIYRERRQMKRNLEKYREMVEKFKLMKKYAFQSMPIRGSRHKYVNTDLSH